MLASDYISDVRELVHDLTTTDWSDAELLRWVNQSRTRVALDLHCVRQLIAGLTTCSQVEIYPINGGIGGLTLTAGGSNYSASPTVTIGAPPAGGTQATAVAVVQSGVITALQMTSWGSGYTSTPSVVITDSTGTLATATAILVNNVLDILSCTALYPGNAQGMTLAWFPFTVFQAWMRANRLQFGFPASWSMIRESNQLYLGRPPDQAYNFEIDAVTLTTDLATTSSLETQIIPPNDDAVKFYAAFLALLKLQNFAQAAEMRDKIYKPRILELQSTKQDRRFTNVYANTYRRMMRGW